MSIKLSKIPFSDKQIKVADAHKGLKINLLFSPDGEKTYTKTKGFNLVEINLEDRRLSIETASEEQFYNSIFFDKDKIVNTSDGKNSFLVNDGKLIDVVEWLESHHITNRELHRQVDANIDLAEDIEKALISLLSENIFNECNRVDSQLLLKNIVIHLNTYFDKINRPEVRSKILAVKVINLLVIHFQATKEPSIVKQYKMASNFLTYQLDSLGLTELEKSEATRLFEKEKKMMSKTKQKKLEKAFLKDFELKTKSQSKKVNMWNILRQYSTINELKNELERLGLVVHFEFLSQFFSYDFILETSPAEESELAIGQSKIGGLPDLPESISWPSDSSGNSLPFIAQINCTKAKDFFMTDSLPETGILYFFYSAKQPWGYTPEDKDKFKVIYYDGDMEKLKRNEFPKDLSNDSKFNSCKVEFKPKFSICFWIWKYINDRIDCPEGISVTDFLSKEKIAINKMLQYPEADADQEEMQRICQFVSSGVDYGKIFDYKFAKESVDIIEERKYDWRLLFQIDSEKDKTGMMWGDSGRLYFWIREWDLVNKNFDRCWVIRHIY